MRKNGRRAFVIAASGKPRKIARQTETTTGPRKTSARAEPGTTRFRDGRATTAPQELQRGPAAPAAHARARGSNLGSVYV